MCLGEYEEKRCSRCFRIIGDSEELCMLCKLHAEDAPPCPMPSPLRNYSVPRIPITLGLAKDWQIDIKKLPPAERFAPPQRVFASGTSESGRRLERFFDTLDEAATWAKSRRLNKYTISTELTTL